MDDEIIGIDITDSIDFSVVSCICGHCKNVIASRKYNPETNELEVPFFARCPKCGIRFKSYVLEKNII